MSHGYHLGHHRVTWLGLRRPARTRRAAVLRADLYHIVGMINTSSAKQIAELLGNFEGE